MGAIPRWKLLAQIAPLEQTGTNYQKAKFWGCSVPSTTSATQPSKGEQY